MRMYSGQARGPGLPVATPQHLDHLGQEWARLRTAVAEGTDTSLGARLADIAVATAAVAAQLHRHHTAQQVLGQTLETLKAACARAPQDLARHLAFARVLEAAALHEHSDSRAAFDALRAAAAVLSPFVPMLHDTHTDPLIRLALSGGLLRPLATAARMLNDAPLRRQTWRNCWEAAMRWAQASQGAADHAQAVEWVVLLAFDLAADELESSAATCLERCEELRAHLDALDAARKSDAVCLLHRSAFQRLWSDAWYRLGDMGEARAALNECECTLNRLDTLPDADAAAVAAQRAALMRDRERLAARTARHDTAVVGA